MFVKEFNDGNQAGKCRSIEAHQPLFYKLKNRYEKEQIAKHAEYKILTSPMLAYQTGKVKDEVWQVLY